MKIYTKKGDSGASALLDGQQKPKSHPTFECLGSLDEVNAHLGAIASAWEWTNRQNDDIQDTVHLLRESQGWLLSIGAAIAGKQDAYTVHDIDAFVARLEQAIDAIDQHLEPLKNFILPGGCNLACKLHIARAVARRAEREVVAWCLESEIGYSMIGFLNRLSDYLFTLARYANAATGVPDTTWKCNA